MPLKEENRMKYDRPDVDERVSEISTPLLQYETKILLFAKNLVLSSS